MAEAKSDDNLMAALSYLLGFITGAVIYVLYKDKGNKYVLFHAMQSIVLGIALFCLMIGLMLVNFILMFIPVLGWVISILSSFVWLALCVGIFALWIFLMYKAYSGVKFKLPVIGPMAEKYAG